jgi:hypothetical protein
MTQRLVRTVGGFEWDLLGACSVSGLQYDVPTNLATT